MVRFSDMLGGNGDSHEARAPVAPRRAGDEPPAPEPEPVAAAPGDDSDVIGHDDPAPAQSPEDVLDRLTQYASSARASDPPPPETPAPEPTAAPADEPADEPLTAVGDDLLPHPKGEKSKRRRK